MANKYKVLEGTHIQGGKAHKKGDVVISERDLVVIFPGKFAVLSAPIPANAPVPVRDEDDDEDAEETTTRPAPVGRTAAGRRLKKSKPVEDEDED